MRLFSEEEDRDQWNPIINMNICRVNRADCNVGRARYLSTYKLLMNDFESKEGAYLNSRLESFDGHLAFVERYVPKFGQNLQI